MRTPLTKETLSRHLAYNWWKYLVAAVLSFLVVDILYTLTAYRVPDNKKVEFYVYGYAEQEALNAYMEDVRLTDFPEMERMDSVIMLDDNNYGLVQLTTYLAVHDGDLYLLPRDQFISTAASGFLLPLDHEESLLSIFSEHGISLQSGWRRETETGETHLYGIPASKLPGLFSRFMIMSDGYLCVLDGGGNEDVTVRFLERLCRDTVTPEEPVSPKPAPVTLPEAP